MATLIVGGIGAGLGFAAGGPAGAQLGFNVGALVGGILFSHNNQQIGRMDDLRVTGSGYGATISSAYGQTRLGGNVIWATDLQEHTHSVTPGKGGGIGGGATQYTYSCSLAVSICRGPIYGIGRIWAQDILIYDSAASPQTRYNVTVYLGDEEQTPNSLMQSVSGAVNVPAYRGQAYVVIESMDLTPWGNAMPSLSFELLQDPNVPTRSCDILTDMALQCGLEDGVDFSFGALYDDVGGYVITARAQAYQLAEPLLSVFGGDVAEVDGRLVGIRRGELPIAHIPASDLGAHDWQGGGSDPPATIQSVRKSDLSLPFRYDLGYVSIERAYQMSIQSAIRHSREQVEDATTYNTAITMHDVDAISGASRKLDEIWLERVTHDFSTGFKWLGLCPGAPFTTEIMGKTVRCRVTQQDISPFGRIAFSVVQDYSASLVSLKAGGYQNQPAAAGYSPPSIQTQQSTYVPTFFDAYSGPEFRDVDGLQPGFYVAATGGDGWQGGTVYYSVDGASWTQGGTVNAKADFGVTTSALAAETVPLHVDTSHTLSVQLFPNGALATASANDIVNGINAALSGAEVLSYQNVAAGAGTLTYDLTTLTRGRRSSAMTGHASGERFWHLNNSIARVNVDPSLIGQTVHVKVVSPNGALADVAAVDVVIHANTYPYATPADVANSQVYYVTNGDPGDPGFVFVEGFPVTTRG